MSWLTHWSYTEAGWKRSIRSSIQSVKVHPVAGPDSMPTQRGVLPSEIIWFTRALNSAHVSGTS